MKEVRNLKKEGDGRWGVNVWFGGGICRGIDHRRYYFATRREAQDATINSKFGVIAIGDYDHGRR